jgi:acetyl esterase
VRRLDDDAAALVAQMEALGRKPMREMDITAVRQVLENAPRPAHVPAMASVEDRTLDGPYGPLPVRVYRPSSDPVLPVVVYFHGGGMVMGSLDSYDAFARNLAAVTGAATVSVGYRLAPEHKFPTGTEEAYFATAWCRQHAREFGGDPDRLGVAGDSAGGGLAAAVALMARDRGGPRLVFQLLMYPGVDRDLSLPSVIEFADGPVLTMDDISWMKTAYLGPEGELPGGTPDHPYGVPANASEVSGVAAAIVVTGHNDPIRDGGERYGLRLRDSGVQTALLRYPGVYHGFLSRPEQLARARLALAEIGGLVRAKFACPVGDPDASW